MTDSDLAGQTLDTVAAFTDGVPTSDTNQTTADSYDGNGDELTMTALQAPGTLNETTGYDFGDAGSIKNNDLLAETDFPDTNTGFPSTIAPGTVPYDDVAGSGQQVYGYDLLGDKLSFQDQNGTIHTYKLDAMGRGIGDSVAFYSGNPFNVDNTVMSLGYTFNDAGLPATQTSYASAGETGTVVNQEQEAYNGLQQLTTDYQSPSGAVDTSTTPAVSYNFNEMADRQNNSNLDSIGYPNQRVEDYTHGANQEPVTEISVSGTTATVTTAAGSSLSSGAIVDIQGSSVAALNGFQTLTYASGDTLKFTVTGGTASDTSSTDMTEAPTNSLDFVIGRTDGIQDHSGDDAGVDLQSYRFLGLSTIVQEVNGNGTELTYIQQSPDSTPPPTTIDSAGDRYTGLDRFGRVIDQNWIMTPTPTPTPTLTTVQRDQYGYDNDSNVLYDSVVDPDETAAASYSELYHASSTSSGDNNSAYDPLNRETTFIRGTLTDSGHNDNTSAPLDTITNANINTLAGSDQTQTLDALGNWSSSATGAGTGGDTAPTLSTTDRTNDSQNQVTSGYASYDNNGNMTGGMGTGTDSYDAWNRLISVNSGGWTVSYLPGSNVASRSCTGSTSAVDSYYTTDMQVLQDDADTLSGGTISSSTVQDQYVWGLAYVNQMVARDDNSSDASLGKSGSGLGERIYPLQDANWNVRTLTSNSGTVLEHITYDNYGNANILTSAYASAAEGIGGDTYNWIYGFQGGRYDTTEGLYRFGARDYSPNLGRWVEQDPDGTVNGPSLYQFVESSPVSGTDPLGLWKVVGPGNLRRKTYMSEGGDDTIGSLARIVGLSSDRNEVDHWLKGGQLCLTDFAGETIKPGALEPNQQFERICKGKEVTVPNVWISANLLQQGGSAVAVADYIGGQLGTLVGTDILSSKDNVKATTYQGLMRALAANVGDIWGIVIFGEGMPDGYLGDGLREDPQQMWHTWGGQGRVIDGLLSQGFRLSTSYAMQCYSFFTGDYQGRGYDWKARWEQTSLNAHGYTGLNILGLGMSDGDR